MSKLIESIKSLKISQVIIVFLAGFILLVNTACSSPNSKVGSTKVSSQEAAKYDAYDATQPKQGGMNGYNDDSRLDNPAVQAKGKKLVDQASKKEPIDSARDYANEVGKGLDKLPETISRQAEDKYNLAKENLDKASNVVKRTANEGYQRLEEQIEDGSKTVKKSM